PAATCISPAHVASSRSRRISRAASAPASRAVRRCSSVEKKPFAIRGAVVLARAVRRSSQVPPKRSSTSTEIAAAPAWAYAGAITAGSASGRRSPAEGERRLISAIACRRSWASASANLPMAELSQLLEPGPGGAGVDRLRGEAEAVADVRGDAGGHERGGRIEKHRITARARLSREHAAQDRGVL